MRDDRSASPWVRTRRRRRSRSGAGSCRSVAARRTRSDRDPANRGCRSTTTAGAEDPRRRTRDPRSCSRSRWACRARTHFRRARGAPPRPCPVPLTRTYQRARNANSAAATAATGMVTASTTRSDRKRSRSTGYLTKVASGSSEIGAIALRSSLSRGGLRLTSGTTSSGKTRIELRVNVSGAS